tara:strand:+ start:525 stop:797 length:273 start_codon:yes stop_codon:yes gene_type:complete
MQDITRFYLIGGDTSQVQRGTLARIGLRRFLAAHLYPADGYGLSFGGKDKGIIYLYRSAMQCPRYNCAKPLRNEDTVDRKEGRENGFGAG